MPMWDGRFSKALDSRVNDFNSSISFDCRMYREDIQGSVAHAKMLAKCGIITDADAKKITNGLAGILIDIESGKLPFDSTAEDIHMFVEAELTKRVGDAGKRLHTARSRNDQVALDTRLYLIRENREIRDKIKSLITVIVEIAENNINTIVPGYTHLQRAQPVTFAHQILAYAQMLLRDSERLAETEKRTSVLPLGACALAGTTYPTDRAFVAKELGFLSVGENSIDCVSDRDFVIELASDLSILMMHLSRLAEEIILWSSTEFGFVELDDAYSTGSSIMPQKKNPDVPELIRGKSGRVFGDLMALLTAMKGLPLAYNKDMQEDKESVFDAVDTVRLCLDTVTPMLATMTIKTDVMSAAVKKGFVNATDFADYLVSLGLPFRDAYKVTGKLVAYCVANSTDLESVSLEDYNKIIKGMRLSVKVDKKLYEAIDPKNCVARRKVFGGPAPEAVKTQIKNIKKKIK